MAPENRDEVRQRIDSLYDRAESDTGNYNATRAMSLAARGRGVPLAKRGGRRSDPSLDAVARQWFDGARAKLGPSVPAVLPKDRQPDRPATPARSRDRADGGLPGVEWGALEPGLPELAPGSASERMMPELTSGSAGLAGRPRAALEAGTTGLPGVAPRLPELPGPDDRNIPELPGGSMPELLAGTVLEPTDRAPAETAVLPVSTLPTAWGTVPQQPGELLASPAAPRRPSPAESKTQNRRKLATAQELLSRYTAALGTPLATVQATHSAPGTWDSWSVGQEIRPSTEWWDQPGLQQPGRPGSQQPFQLDPRQPDQLGTGQWQQPQWTAPGAPTAPSPAAPLTIGATVTDAGSLARPLTDAGSVAPLTDTGSFSPLTDTGSFAPLTDTGSLPAVAAARSTRSLRVAKAIAFARAQVGKPCVWGATGPDSYDCSSLTQGAWKAAGVTLPRAAHEQALAGTPVTLAGLEPGDLVLFFDDDRHVGLHTGDGMMIHAPGPGSYIREESIYGAGESAIHRVIRPA